MVRVALVVALSAMLAASQAFVPPVPAPHTRRDVSVSATFDDWKKGLAKAVFVALPFAAPLVAGAKIDYEGIKYLGGGDKVDINNANVRVYSKFQGMYPTIAKKIVSNGPYKSVGDVFSIADLTEQEKAVLKKYQDKFVALDPVPEYFIDRINNGLYR